jgi:hypothetical protein
MSPGAGGVGRAAGRAAGRGRGDLLGGHHQRKRDDNVGAARADGAPVVGAGHELTQGVGQTALDPVPDNHPGANIGGGKELVGQRRRGTHPFILGPVDSIVRTRVTPG